VEEGSATHAHRWLAGIVSLCLVAAPAASQDLINLHQWGSVTLFHGLPSDHVRAIAQDADGVLWFGTDGGLAKYDGRRTQKIVHPGLPGTQIRALKADRNGVLWVGTDSGAARVIAGEFRAIPETAGQAITTIVSREHGPTLLATEQGHIFTLENNSDGTVRVKSIGPKDTALLRLASDAPLPLTSLAIANDGIIIGTRGRGLLTMNGRVIKEIINRPRPFFIGGLTLDRAGRLWFGAETTEGDSGLYDGSDLLKPGKTGAGTGTVTSLDFDSRGDLWAGSRGQGAFWYRDSRELAHFTFENTAGGLRSNNIYFVFIDREGVVWFGTDRGVCRYDPGGPHIETLSSHPESNFVRSLFQSMNGSWWAGTNRGLFVREAGRANWQPVEAMAGRAIHTLFEDRDGRLLVGASGGLFREWTRVDRDTQEIRAADSVRAIAEFQGLPYLANFGFGLERLDGTGRTHVWPPETADAPERNLVSLQTDGDARLLIGTAQAGVFVFDGSGVKPDESLAELKGSPVWDMERTKDGSLWLATGRGVFVHRLNKLEEIVAGSDVRRLVTALNDSATAIWCATAGNGLFKILLQSNRTIVTRFNTEHGLPSDSVFALLRDGSASGKESFWLGTNRGIARYEPGAVAPMLHATRILGQRPFPTDELKDGLNLEYPQNSLLLEVAAISSRTFPEQFQYEFSLMDNDGKIIKERVARDSQFVMENLRPGRYQVTATAFGNDLTPSAPLTFGFNVAGAPFPWMSAALSILLGWSLVALGYGYKKNRLLTQSNAALAETRRQLANETENERRRISRDLHDQTLSDLRRLLLLTDRMPAQSEPNPIVFRGEIESISTEIRHICEDLSPSVLANVGLAAALEWALADMVAHLPADQKVEYEFKADDDLERLAFDDADEIQIYRILQEAISNVGRHARATKVRLSVEIAGADLLVALEDNGQGFDWSNAQTREGRGLNNIRSRASLIDAKVEWRSRPEGGSVFTLRKTLPSVTFRTT